MRTDRWNTNAFHLAPLATVVDVNAVLWNVSTARITWTFQRHDVLLLNGKFRAFAVTLYHNFSKSTERLSTVNSHAPFSSDMSTLMTMETVNSYLIVQNLSSSSQYTVSVAICNHANCGPSSFAIHFETSSSSRLSHFRSTVCIIIIFSSRFRHIDHLATSVEQAASSRVSITELCMASQVLHRPRSSLHLLLTFSSRSAIPPFMVNNNSLFIAHPKPGQTDGQFQCGDKNYSIQLYGSSFPCRRSIERVPIPHR